MTEFVDGQTLHQWLIDNPKPPVETVRGIIEQIANGLLAFHRLEMLHQDLRPQNVMIDATGTVKIIDFGSTRVAGISEIDSPLERSEMLGTVQYTAPEYFLGESGDAAFGPVFAGGHRLPDVVGPAAVRRRGSEGAHARGAAPVEIPIGARRRTRDPGVDRRGAAQGHASGSRPGATRNCRSSSTNCATRAEAYLSRTRAPLLERNPVAFWRGVSLILAVAVVILLLN